MLRRLGSGGRAAVHTLGLGSLSVVERPRRASVSGGWTLRARSQPSACTPALLCFCSVLSPLFATAVQATSPWHRELLPGEQRPCSHQIRNPLCFQGPPGLDFVWNEQSSRWPSDASASPRGEAGHVTPVLSCAGLTVFASHDQAVPSRPLELVPDSRVITCVSEHRRAAGPEVCPAPLPCGSPGAPTVVVFGVDAGSTGGCLCLGLSRFKLHSGVGLPGCRVRVPWSICHCSPDSKRPPKVGSPRFKDAPARSGWLDPSECHLGGGTGTPQAFSSLCTCLSLSLRRGVCHLGPEVETS